MRTTSEINLRKKTKEEGKTGEFTKLQLALNDSSDKNRNFLIAFLLIEVYILAATISITDQQLLLIDNQQSFALFNFKIPLIGFYWLAPLIQLAFHYNVLFNLREHSKKLNAWLNHENNNHQSDYLLLKPYIFNIWAKYNHIKNRYNTVDYLLLNGIIQLLFAIIPLSLLVFILWRMTSIQFIELSTWHLACAICNIMLLAHFWPSVKKPKFQEENNRCIYTLWQMVWQTLTSAYLLFALLLVIGRYTLLSQVISAPAKLKDWLDEPYWAFLVPRLDVSGITLNKPDSTIAVIQPDQRDWTGLTEVTECGLANQYQQITLKNRPLNLINLSEAVLCNVDFSGSHMQGAQLNQAIFSGHFNLTNLAWADLRKTQFQRNTDLIKATLDNTSVSYTVANGVDLTLASFKQAKILSSEFAHTNFVQTTLEKSEISLTKLKLANFMSANFNGTHFIHTKLSGVNLSLVKKLESTKLENSEIRNCIVDNRLAVKQFDVFETANCRTEYNNVNITHDHRYKDKLQRLRTLFNITRYEMIRNDTAEDFDALIDQLIVATELSKAESINLSSLSLKTLPHKLFTLKQLKKLDLSNNQLTSDQIALLIHHLPNLTHLSLYRNKLTSLPDNIGHLSQLQTLWLSGNKLTDLPDSIGQLNQLRGLYLSSNKLTTLPIKIGNLSQLQYLNLTYNKLSELPDTLRSLDQLKKIQLGGNVITEYPNSLKHLTQLTSFTTR